MTSGVDTAVYFLAKAEESAWRMEMQWAGAYYDSARVALEKRVQAGLYLRSQHPGEARSLLGIAYAGLGRAEEATREGEQAVDLLPPSRDAVVGPYGIVYLA